MSSPTLRLSGEGSVYLSCDKNTRLRFTLHQPWGSCCNRLAAPVLSSADLCTHSRSVLEPKKIRKGLSAESRRCPCLLALPRII